MHPYSGETGAGHKGGVYVAPAGADDGRDDALDDTSSPTATPTAPTAVVAPPLPVFSDGPAGWSTSIGMNLAPATAAPAVVGGAAAVATVQAFAAAGSPEVIAAPTVVSGVFVG